MSLTIPLEIAAVIRELRQQLGLSQEKLAAKLGVSFRTVNRWENGRAVPSALALKQIEELLHQMSDSSKATVRKFGKELLAQYFEE
ncbi:helix-turn-helix transcriptional regulator [Kamptonema animale CS-326]|jgi:putative transcriptional regulator|uniref:helix-turn-helix domain-containing protein n=1 Tax=Kamptonema animale TaxID=92934 RepID=UPI00232F95B7|nr:helix-turn-helix transcriptional regulator [Kamptonema animale]MDB9515166.1 helix-turn-helix transcriptional regulator [Kamptonema animale CS-326]